jgi:hypothetical protein
VLVEAVPYGFTLAIWTDNFYRPTWSEVHCVIFSMVSLQHFVRIMMVAQWISYWYRMNACVEATSVHTTAILHHFWRTWWKKYTLQISYVTVFTHILIQQNYHCTTVLAVTGVHCKPCAMMVTDVHCKHCAIMVSGVYCKSCAMMVAAVQCWPLILSCDGHLGLCKPCALCHDGHPLSCTMLVTGVQCWPLILYHVGHWCPLQTSTLWHGSHQCMLCNV